MGFLAPLFLAGILAVGIPIFVHLTHKEKREVVRFPSLMFLHRVPFRSRQRQRIRHWWLFALRALAVLLLAAAFARPVLHSRILGGAAPREVAIVLDRSASMGAADRWARAVAAARAAADAVPSGGRVGLYAAGDIVEIAQAPTDQPSAISAALNTLGPADGGANLPAAVRLAADRLAQAGGGELVLISDFQRSGFDRAEPATLPNGIQLRTVDVGEAPVPNVGIAGLSVEAAPNDPDRVIVTARLVATGIGAARTVPVRLELEGRLAAAETVSVQPGAGASAQFESLRRPERARAGRVILPGDGYRADDVHHFVFAAPQQVGVLFLSRGGAPGGESFYVRQALAVAADPRLPIAARTAGAVRDADLAGARVAILHDTPFPAGSAGDRLLAWVGRGNGLLIALGAGGTIPAALRDSVGAAGPMVDRGTSGATLGPADPQHPVFAMWGANPRDALAAARAWRYRRLDGRRGVIARFDDGAPALVETPFGRGRILIWSGDLANKWNDLPVQPAFVPLLLSAARYLAAYAPQPPSRPVGEVADLHVLANAAGPLVAERPGGARAPLNDAGRLPLAAAGTWTVRRQGSRDALLLVAANTPPSESDPARVDPATAVQTGGAAALTVAGDVNAAADGERRQRIWWFALAGVLVLLATESVVASRLRGYV